MDWSNGFIPTVLTALSSCIIALAVVGGVESASIDSCILLARARGAFNHLIEEGICARV